MATSKKVAIKKTQKAAAPAKKATVKQATPAKKAAAKPAAKTSAVSPAKAPVKTAAPKVASKPSKPTVAKKVVATKSKSPVTQTASSSKSVVKKTPVAASAAPQPVKKAVTAKQAASVKAPDTKKVVTQRVTADKEKQISKPEEKVVIMPVKNNKEDKEKAVAKDAGKKTAEKVQKTEKVAAKAEKPSGERTEKADKKGSKATTLVTYQPEFTKSVLDQPEQPAGPVYRYSDTDLQEFKDLILKKLESAKKELVYLQGLITRKDEAGTDDTENKYMSMEDGSGSQEREQLNQMASRQIQFIDHLEKALVRIENKTYGICRVTGKLIDKARLRAVPHATLSIEAKLAKSK
ncbi:TraR/DksA C4-type zinc finger protein [Chitinophaga tropicalis]|uniref:TraR/DksA family transcriptional regulator n=1 Tax=Chitinophaga tropicalis TaxID=2683588 RepID=A0A7K1TXI2_9BACT|nr:TraR/DksA C4-type zinc finger protein [Chitinophaga tropicalis]MVT06807.1 TraR/DksA family transcriptional regulator [Chitinophaga tropicalis]